ncbi:hypothetical protein [Streptomyces sp. FH025]|uniref:hypothetical protein n=1 Tax=Streptomyces sp. FH025 TaxID=2815937 RepID=UPI001A9DD439|nr:hypothetical protein [Streptomyces sp. FH025]MBO1415385.1 hypothetical protein [Streptomyces sp. FH025]
MYRERLEFDPGELAADEETDLHSFVFGLWSRGVLRSTLRVTPAGAPRLEMRELGVFPRHEIGAPDACEITRFAAEGHGLRYGEAVVHGCARWMLLNTPITRYYAYGRPGPADYFRRALGSVVLPGRDFGIAARGVDNYRTLTGTMADFERFTAHVRSHFAPDSLFPPSASDGPARLAASSAG